MSKMPAKKKSCFQITSVIQAQVAGNSITDDAESNDDLDDSGTGDAPLEALDVARTDLGVCDHISPEDTLGHTGDDQNGPVVNGLLSIQDIDTGGHNTPLNLGGSTPVPAATQPIVPTPTSQPSSVSSSGAATSCSSRFRVIKLDHSSGEPFKRGRWACTEFYEKETDSNRTVDGMKSMNDNSIDRDNGLGAINAVAAPRAFPAQSVENTDGGHLKASTGLQPVNSLAPQIGSAASAFQPIGYATAKAHENVKPVVSQTLIPDSHDGVHKGSLLQKSPSVRPSTTQPQQLSYSNGMSPSQPDYHPQHLGSQSMVPPSSQPPVSAAAGPGGQCLQAQASEAGSAQGLNPLTVTTQAVNPVSQTLGRMGITISSPVTVTSHSGIYSIPATGIIAPMGQTQNTRSNSGALPLSISSVVPGIAAVKPLINDGLILPAPAVSLFGITIPMDGDDDSASGASVVAIDNKIEQAMDLVKNHLMYAVREEVEVLKEQIKELYERNSVLERENAVLKSLANSEQLSKLSSQLKQVNNVALPQLQQSTSTNNNNALVHYEVVKSAPHQPNITTA